MPMWFGRRCIRSIGNGEYFLERPCYPTIFQRFCTGVWLRYCRQYKRRVLEYACVFLSDFSFELLAAVSGAGMSWSYWMYLDDLIAEGLLMEACGEAEDRYRFSQDLCRRAIYDRVQDVRRRLLHREIGSALEKTEHAEELTEELADHFAAAEEQNKAVKYMCLAGKKSIGGTSVSPGKDAVRGRTGLGKWTG